MSDLHGGARHASEAATVVEAAPADDERALWERFADAGTVEDFAGSWLALQCRMVGGVRAGLVLLGQSGQAPYGPVAVWPDAGFALERLGAAAEQALEERRGRLIANPPASGEARAESYVVTYPLEVAGQLHGVVVLELDPRRKADLQSVLRRLHWGAAWLELLVRRGDAVRHAASGGRLEAALDMVAEALDHRRFHAAATAVVTELAIRLACTRVSVGFVRGRHVRVRALSHSAKFGKHSNLVRAIGAAMDEALDQQSVVTHPGSGARPDQVTRLHRALAEQHGSGSVLTVPLVDGEDVVGGLTLERAEAEPFVEDTVELCRHVALLVGPVLEMKRRDDRLIVHKAWDSLRGQLGKLFGAGHLGLKLTVLGLLAAVALFAVAEGDFRVTADASLEGAVQRAVVAPIPGYVLAANARAGDIVRAGDVLCTLDDRDLRLERLRWFGQREQLLRQHRDALSGGERAEVNILGAQIEQAEAQIALVDEQLARTTITAPFDGVLVSGDLSQSLGAPVERGDVLFQVAPLDAYRVILEVDERDITEVAKGQRGHLALSGLPAKPLPLVVEKLTPVSSAEEGRNYFRVEARLEELLPVLRPGMEGVGKITIDRRKLIWIWTRELMNWLRLWTWSWIP